MNDIKQCPICDSSEFTPFISAVDYTVSNDTFNIVSCNNCGFHFTNPIPTVDKIGEYYKAESYISHSSTNKGIINKLYQRVRKHTLKQKVKLVKRVGKGKDTLDIGAGTGHFLNACQLAGFNALGLEPDVDARTFAIENFKANIQELDELYNLPDGSRDVITMWHVLEHVYDLRRDLDKITRILKPDGRLIIAVPNMSSFDAKHYKEFWAAYDLPIHLYHFVPDDIKRLFEHYDMELEEMQPMKFDSYYVSMLSEKYKGGNIVKAFWNGCRSNLKAKNGTYSSQIYILKKKGH
ncbi:MAG: methyltransferase domain-containing protein [Crocinitomix sp.]|nr:methyltransferase domain-containing protein [Crocinitomix sp.]